MRQKKRQWMKLKKVAWGFRTPEYLTEGIALSECATLNSGKYGLTHDFKVFPDMYKSGRFEILAAIKDPSSPKTIGKIKPAPPIWAELNAPYTPKDYYKWLLRN
jgi:hypothetical protein